MADASSVALHEQALTKLRDSLAAIVESTHGPRAVSDADAPNLPNLLAFVLCDGARPPSDLTPFPPWAYVRVACELTKYQTLVRKVDRNGVLRNDPQRVEVFVREGLNSGDAPALTRTMLRPDLASARAAFYQGSALLRSESAMERLLVLCDALAGFSFAFYVPFDTGDPLPASALSPAGSEPGRAAATAGFNGSANASSARAGAPASVGSSQASGITPLVSRLEALASPAVRTGLRTVAAVLDRFPLVSVSGIDASGDSTSGPSPAYGSTALLAGAAEEEDGHMVLRTSIGSAERATDAADRALSGAVRIAGCGQRPLVRPDLLPSLLRAAAQPRPRTGAAAATTAAAAASGAGAGPGPGLGSRHHRSLFGAPLSALVHDPSVCRSALLDPSHAVPDFVADACAQLRDAIQQAMRAAAATSSSSRAHRSPSGIGSSAATSSTSSLAGIGCAVPSIAVTLAFAEEVEATGRADGLCLRPVRCGSGAAGAADRNAFDSDCTSADPTAVRSDPSTGAAGASPVADSSPLAAATLQPSDEDAAHAAMALLSLLYHWCLLLPQSPLHPSGFDAFLACAALPASPASASPASRSNGRTAVASSASTVSGIISSSGGSGSSVTAGSSVSGSSASGSAASFDPEASPSADAVNHDSTSMRHDDDDDDRDEPGVSPRLAAMRQLVLDQPPEHGALLALLLPLLHACARLNASSAVANSSSDRAGVRYDRRDRRDDAGMRAAVAALAASTYAILVRPPGVYVAPPALPSAFPSSPPGEASAKGVGASGLGTAATAAAGAAAVASAMNAAGKAVSDALVATGKLFTFPTGEIGSGASGSSAPGSASSPAASLFGSRRSGTAVVGVAIPPLPPLPDEGHSGDGDGVSAGVNMTASSGNAAADSRSRTSPAAGSGGVNASTGGLFARIGRRSSGSPAGSSNVGSATQTGSAATAAAATAAAAASEATRRLPVVGSVLELAQGAVLRLTLSERRLLERGVRLLIRHAHYVTQDVAARAAAAQMRVHCGLRSLCAGFAALATDARWKPSRPSESSSSDSSSARSRSAGEVTASSSAPTSAASRDASTRAINFASSGGAAASSSAASAAPAAAAAPELFAAKSPRATAAQLLLARLLGATRRSVCDTASPTCISWLTAADAPQAGPASASDAAAAAAASRDPESAALTPHDHLLLRAMGFGRPGSCCCDALAGAWCSGACAAALAASSGSTAASSAQIAPPAGLLGLAVLVHIAEAYPLLWGSWLASMGPPPDREHSNDDAPAPGRRRGSATSSSAAGGAGAGTAARGDDDEEDDSDASAPASPQPRPHASSTHGLIETEIDGFIAVELPTLRRATTTAAGHGDDGYHSGHGHASGSANRNRRMRTEWWPMAPAIVACARHLAAACGFMGRSLDDSLPGPGLAGGPGSGGAGRALASGSVPQQLSCADPALQLITSDQGEPLLLLLQPCGGDGGALSAVAAANGTDNRSIRAFSPLSVVAAAPDLWALVRASCDSHPGPVSATADDGASAASAAASASSACASAAPAPAPAPASAGSVGTMPPVASFLPSPPTALLSLCALAGGILYTRWMLGHRPAAGSAAPSERDLPALAALACADALRLLPRLLPSNDETLLEATVDTSSTSGCASTAPTASLAGERVTLACNRAASTAGGQAFDVVTALGIWRSLRDSNTGSSATPATAFSGSAGTGAATGPRHTTSLGLRSAVSLSGSAAPFPTDHQQQQRHQHPPLHPPAGGTGRPVLPDNHLYRYTAATGSAAAAASDSGSTQTHIRRGTAVPGGTGASLAAVTTAAAAGDPVAHPASSAAAAGGGAALGVPPSGAPGHARPRSLSLSDASLPPPHGDGASRDGGGPLTSSAGRSMAASAATGTPAATATTAAAAAPPWAHADLSLALPPTPTGALHPHATATVLSASLAPAPGVAASPDACVWPAIALAGPSDILHPACPHAALLEASLPRGFRGYTWQCVYSLARHGAALETLLTRCRGEEATLIVMRDDGGTVFGGFASENWRAGGGTSAARGGALLRPGRGGAGVGGGSGSMGTYFGNGQACVFTFAPREDFNAFRRRKQREAQAAAGSGSGAISCASDGVGSSESGVMAGEPAPAFSGGHHDAEAEHVRLSEFAASPEAATLGPRSASTAIGIPSSARGHSCRAVAAAASGGAHATPHAAGAAGAAAAAASAGGGSPEATGGSGAGAAPAPTPAGLAASTGHSARFSTAQLSGVPFSLYKWSPGRRNKYFQLLAPGDGMAMGGGGAFAWFVDGDLCYGASGLCDTFLSPCLASAERFTVISMEVWAVRKRAV